MINRAKKELEEADALILSTGAGMGVDSGLPDFRGNKGFWKAYPPLKKLGISFIEMANPEWFFQNPELAWGFYGHRLNLYRETFPHKGFYRLLDYAKSRTKGYYVYTSNVDGQFQKAGFSKDRIYEIHGSIHYLQCSIPCTRKSWPVEDLNLSIDTSTFRAVGELPQCPYCGAIARPNILMFGDYHWLENRFSEQSRKLYAWLETLKNQKLVVIEIGAGKAIPSVRRFSDYLIKYLNATLIRINPRDFDVPIGQISIEKGALEGIELLFN